MNWPGVPRAGLTIPLEGEAATKRGRLTRTHMSAIVAVSFFRLLLFQIASLSNHPDVLLLLRTSVEGG